MSGDSDVENGGCDLQRAGGGELFISDVALENRYTDPTDVDSVAPTTDQGPPAELGVTRGELAGRDGPYPGSELTEKTEQATMCDCGWWYFNID